MAGGAIGRGLVALGVGALLLAGCGRESDLHTGAPLAPTATARPEPAQTPGKPAAGSTGPLPTPVPTEIWPSAPAPPCPAAAQPAGTYDGVLLPVAVPTSAAMRLEPRPMPTSAATRLLSPPRSTEGLDQPATFLIPPDCTGRVLALQRGDTIDVLMRRYANWSAATSPPGVLQPVGLQMAADGGHWRFRAAQPGTASLSIYIDWSNPLTLGVVVK